FCATICSPLLAAFSDFFLGLATTVHHSCSAMACHSWRKQRVCAKFIGEKPAGYQPAARCSQNSSQRPLSWEQRRAIIALAWLTVQRIPDCFSRCPMIVLQPASTTPEPTK